MTKLFVTGSLETPLLY